MCVFMMCVVVSPKTLALVVIGVEGFKYAPVFSYPDVWKSLEVF